MAAVDFLLYCAGISTVLVSGAGAIRLIIGGKGTTKKEPPAVKREAIMDPGTDVLQERLQAFQTARYASPITQRRLDADAGPAPRPYLGGRQRPEIRLRPDNALPKLQKPTGEPPKEGT